MAEEPILVLRGERIGLGPLRMELAETYARWFNDLRVTRTLAAPSMPMSVEKERKWLETILESTSDAIFTIYILDSMRPFGNVGLHGIDHSSNTAEFGIVIGEVDVWGQGYGTEATRLIVQYGFDVLGLHNIELRCYGNNPAGLRAYEKAGFKLIGRRRGAKKIGRERYDEWYMDILSTDVGPSNLHHLMQDGTT